MLSLASVMAMNPKIYEFTRDEELYDVLTESVRDMLTVAEGDGRVSTYERESEFNGWDMWSRKYVILACEYYLDICHDEARHGKAFEGLLKRYFG